MTDPVGNLRAVLTITDSNAKLSSGLLLFAGRKLLLLKRAPDAGNGGTWGLPGGQRSSAEASYAAALRESIEEMGEVPPHAVVAELAIHRGSRRYELFACKTRKRVRTAWCPRLNHEHVDYRWANFAWCLDNLKRLHPVLRILLQDSEGQKWLQSVFAQPRPKAMDGGRRASDHTVSAVSSRLRKNT